MGKGSAPQPHTPIEAPNTLRSRSIARLVDLISEGEIDGLVDGLKSIYLDDTPLQNADGSFNFSNMKVDVRTGTPDQTPMTGFPAVESEVSVGVEVRNVSSVTRTVSNPDATAARITIRLDGLQSVNSNTGDINPTSVQIAIDVRETGGPWAEVISPEMGTIAGKTSSAYQRSYRVERPVAAGTGDWDWRVRRITADNASSTLVNKTYVDSFTIVEDYQLSYPHSALIGYEVDAESFGGRVPKRLAHVNGIKTRIPSNYDPLTRAYTGVWDGTFRTARHSNPAWALFECVANDRWGVGDFVPEPLRDKWTLYSIGQYCDELVPDGLGGFEPRYKFDWAISSGTEALKVLMSIASVFRGMIYWGSAGITSSADRDLDPSKLVTPANVIGGLFNWGGGGLKARHTVAIVTFYDPTDFCRPTTEVVEGDPADIVRWGYNTLEVVAVGCTSRGQAHRMGRWALESESSEAETCSWQAAFDHADTYPGEIAEIQDPAYAGVEFGGRVAELVDLGAGPVGIVVDRPVTLEIGKTYILNVTLSDGTVAVRPLTTGPSVGSTLSFDIPLSPPPVINAVWVLTASDVAPRRVKIIKRTEGTKGNIFDLAGVLHDPTKFPRIEQNLSLDPPSYSRLPSGPLVGPTNLVARECLTLVGGGLPRSKVVLSWTPSTDPRVINYETQTRPPGENWQPASPQFVSGASNDLLDLTAGSWGFRVRALDGTGRSSPWLTLEATDLDGLLFPPADITNLRTSFVDSTTYIHWDEVNDLRDHRYEIRKGISWESGLSVGDVAHPPFASVGDDTYWIGTYIGPDAGPRTYSTSPPQIIITGSLLATNIIQIFDERSLAWPGTFEGGSGPAPPDIRTGGGGDIAGIVDVAAVVDILNAGGQQSGIYTIPVAHRVLIGRAAPCRVQIDYSGQGAPAGQDISLDPDITINPDVTGSDASRSVDVYPEIRLSQDGVTWGPWQRFSAGVYTAWGFDARMQLITYDPGVIAYCTGFTFAVDVPDRTDHITAQAVIAAGTTINYRPDGAASDAAFNGGPNSALVPNIQVTIRDAQNGDYVQLTAVTLSNFNIRIMNGGVGVDRTVDLLIRGY